MGVYSHKERSTRDGYNAFPRDMPRWWFFSWKNLAKIRPENGGFDQYKGFFVGKMVQIHQISKRK